MRIGKRRAVDRPVPENRPRPVAKLTVAYSDCERPVSPEALVGWACCRLFIDWRSRVSQDCPTVPEIRATSLYWRNAKLWLVRFQANA